jgi:hypothetical protein
LSLVAGGAVSAQVRPAERRSGNSLGERWRVPAPSNPTLSELFAAPPRDGGWIGFLLAQLDASKPLLWVQERMAILESGRVHPPGLATQNLVHVEARDAKDALWAMEEGLRCPALSCVIGEIWGDPRALDFTATRRGRLFDSAGRPRQFERRAHALADRERPFADQRPRPESAGAVGVGCRAVPRARNAAGPVVHRA